MRKRNWHVNKYGEPHLFNTTEKFVFGIGIVVLLLICFSL